MSHNFICEHLLNLLICFSLAEFHLFAHSKVAEMQWRTAGKYLFRVLEFIVLGLTYLRYSQLAAAVTRSCTKPSAKKAVIAESTLKIQKWESGKPLLKN
jgi:hypothetical protein